MCSFLCHFSFGAQGQRHERKQVKKQTIKQQQNSHILQLTTSSLSLSLSPSLPSPQHTESVGLLKNIGFKCWFEEWEGVGWPDFVRESVPDCRRSIRKWSLTKWVSAYSGNTENGSIGRWAKLAGWLVDSQEFGQVVRSSWVEAIITERRECVLYPWINGQPMKRSKMRRNVVRFRNS